MKSRILISIFLLASFYGCQKEYKYTNIGEDLLPESEKFNLSYTDTIQLKAFTLSEDSVQINNSSLNLLGSYNDPVYGTHTANFATQIRLAKNNTIFGSADSIQFDSLVFYMYYTSFYGDTNSYSPPSVQYVDVFELDSSLVYADTYYNNMVIDDYYNPEISLARFELNGDSSNLVRVNIAGGLGEKLLFAGDTNLIDNTVFLPYFKGLFFKAEKVASDGRIYYFDLENEASRLTIYYTNTNSQVQQEYSFIVNINCAKLNLFEHDYSNATISSIDNLSVEDTVVYIQSMAGLRSKIEIPNMHEIIDFFNQENAAINNAEIVFTIQKKDTQYDKYLVNERLNLYAINEDGSKQNIEDLVSLSSSGFPVYNAIVYDNENGSYTFNITSYFQEVIQGNLVFNGLYLYPNQQISNAERVVINSGNSTNPIKLKITYSKI